MARDPGANALIADPARRGETLAAFALSMIPRLWVEIAESARLPRDFAPLRLEWDCFGLYACVRGLVAAGGFNRETAAAVDALHQHVLEAWAAEDFAALDARRARVAERYAEYGAIGQDGGASGAATVTRRLGEACARHLAAAAAGDGSSGGATTTRSELAFEELAELVGGVHEALSEGAAEAVRVAA